MKSLVDLKTVHVTDFKSIRDSNQFEVGDVTCLVGKNEAGKTALLQAIYRVHPIITEHGVFDVTDDYPRADVEDYEQGIDEGKSHAIVVRLGYEVKAPLVEQIENEFGEGVLNNPTLELSKGYKNTLYISLPVNERKACEHLSAAAKLPDDLSENIKDVQTLKDLAGHLKQYIDDKTREAEQAKNDANKIEDEQQKKNALADAAKLVAAPQVGKLHERVKAILDDRGLNLHIYNKHVEANVPKFLYFDEYYQMKGHLNIEKLRQRQNENRLDESDRPMLGLIELARLDIDQLVSPERTEVLVSKLEGASNHLSKQILKYWSQNKHLHVRFDVRPANPKDPEGMQEGTNLWGRVFDSVHEVTTLLGRRSRGFIWFFSFLAWFSQQKKHQGPLILLLDEPGLFLHAMAQGDLLRYMEAELQPHHQVIFTTHSPFMIDPQRFDRIRIVEDKSIDAHDELPDEEKGTKVLVEALEASDDSLFPLQGALGFDIAQTLFVGPNCLIVEGVSDLLYLQCLTRILEEKGRVGLDAKWTITPVGGSDKVPTFVALLGAQKKLKVATLIDIAGGDVQKIENLYKRKLLKKKNVQTFADFTGKNESDAEDMFDTDFYLKLVNAEYSDSLQADITSGDISGPQDRILVRIEKHLDDNPMSGGVKFNHYRPARYFCEHEADLKGELSSDCLDRFEAAFKALNALL